MPEIEKSNLVRITTGLFAGELGIVTQVVPVKVVVAIGMGEPIEVEASELEFVAE